MHFFAGAISGIVVLSVWVMLISAIVYNGYATPFFIGFFGTPLLIVAISCLILKFAKHP